MEEGIVGKEPEKTPEQIIKEEAAETEKDIILECRMRPADRAVKWRLPEKNEDATHMLKVLDVAVSEKLILSLLAKASKIINPHAH